MSSPSEILQTYETVADQWDRRRDKSLFERRHLDRMLGYAPGRRILDLGCGAGRPIARYLNDRRATVTGLDGAPTMARRFAENLPDCEVIVGDMRTMALGRQFDAVLAWNSFFHLSPDDQRAMFPVFANHLVARGILMFTAGPRAGQPIGQVEGLSVYHASLSPSEYRDLFAKNGFEEISFTPEDPDCNGHTVWMARRTVSS
ncbi:MAG: class I SAM-dependent methyltransferase [Rhodobacteraceae bacterium]|nr:class I SAM-dependent methyltransferase [Paracoccaceae bacterium]